MCDLVESYARECAEEAAKEAAKEAVKEEAQNNARKFFENGASYEMVKASITSLSDEELQTIYQEVNNKK